jgi:hypothetical protein
MPFLADRIFGWKPLTIDEDWGLQTIKAGTAYSICNTLQCSDCDFVFLDIRFSDAELANLYRDYRGDQYNDLRELYEPGYSDRNRSLNAGIYYIPVIEKFLEPYVSFPLRILDWGGDTGKNTPFMNRSTSCDIFDISGKPVIPGAQRVEMSDVFTREYDLVVCSNVLEHIPYPSDLICDMMRAMSNDSILYIEVPYENIMQSVSGGGGEAYKRKRHWHEHINFFSEKSLTSLTKNCGLEIIAMRSIDGTAGGNSSAIFQLTCKLCND